jgi:ABC-type transport system involved in cytochrome bd biosynthesis fused ATPase/permease subunit
MMNMETASLQSAFRFTTVDLEANRHGRLSVAQLHVWDALRAYNQQAAAQSSSKFVVGFFVLMLMIFGVALYATGVLKQLAAALGLLIIPAAALAALLIVVLLRAAVGAQRSSIATVAAMGDTDQDVPTVSSITGYVQTVHEVSYRRTGAADIGRRIDHYFLIVGDGTRTLKMSITERGMDTFEAGRQYIVYFYENWGVLTFLTAEPR